MRELWNYLWSLPYECRLLYFKFKQVKHEADVLKADVDELIYKREAVLSSASTGVTP